MKRIDNLTHLIFILLISSIYSCRRSTEVIPTIDIEANINNMKITNLSEFTDDIRYVPLESNEKLTLMNLNEVRFFNNMFLISAGSHCLLFDSDGHFMRKISSKGRGPGEYEFITNIGIGGLSKDRIFICSLYDLLEFDLKGTLIDKYSKSFLINDYYLLRNCSLMNDSLFLGLIYNRKGNSEYKGMIINKYGKVKAAYRDYERSGGYGGLPCTYQFKNTTYFKQQFNDTLFSINKEYQLIPSFIFKLGNLKLPLKIRLTFPMGDIVRNYILINDIFETENLVIFSCDFGNRFPAKRLTPKPSIFPGGGVVWTNTNGIVGIYKKKSRDLTFIKPSNTDNPLYTSGFYNDIDCGPRFYPLTMVNDSTLITWINPDKLKAHVSSDEFKNNEPKHPEKKKELKELADKLTDFDNPVLMIVSFKK